jgi:regulator of protease activity HflC (stomatin/prohibitin superfamily)
LLPLSTFILESSFVCRCARSNAFPKASILPNKMSLPKYNIIVDAISITEFEFSADFVRALQAQNELRRIEIEAQQAEARAVGEQQANIARAEGVRQANVLQAQGEAQAITTIDEQLRQSPSYLEWLKSQRWDGQLPLVVSGGAGSGETPFISIPTSGSGSTTGGTNVTTAE